MAANDTTAGTSDDATGGSSAGRVQTSSEADRSSPDARGVDVERGDAVVPDAEDAADREDLKPEDPPDGAPAEGDPAKKTAVAAPIPAHGEMASREQLQEAARAAQEEDEEA